jgi:hypothetical protein
MTCLGHVRSDQEHSTIFSSSSNISLGKAWDLRGAQFTVFCLVIVVLSSALDRALVSSSVMNFSLIGLTSRAL